ncbi:MAG: hypothetical protein COU32_03010 [Candidatus Magasanikbacteria bacterium CG10_big_fil_rev_8_21_14_0_10_42_10]|uniref:Lipoprotein n=2 Tax=Candidatus Magasanikiibacteriota TaxID=1752731 RepID=A0A2H0TVP4_9BACT|nr:MAG: hypothetical protein COU32_03010 [Candidatus Magasanikbacteria bacterium CG10_big_fil_rev_8_21_14_0_10_42_10]PIZ93232.1 MAG: hypothetical protein COX82_03260 [Candidatus Magasanikbacteria bacterium CG_4_10_14_0_2_um_filter_41_10]
MKHLFFVFVALLTLSGCGSSLPQQTNNTPEKVLPSDPSSREIVQHADEGSCFSYELVENGIPVEVPLGVTMASTCSAIPPVLSKDKKMLAFTNEAGVHVYEIGAESFSSAEYIYGSIIDGVGPLVWNDTGDRLAFVEISQQEYPLLTKIGVLNMKTGDTLLYDAKVNFSCGSVCTAFTDDVQFSGDRELTYTTWDKAPYDLEGTIEAIRVLPIE